MTIEYTRGTFRELLHVPTIHVPTIEGEHVAPRLRKGLHTIERYDGKPVRVVLSPEEELDLLAGLDTLIDLSTVQHKTVYGIPFDVARDERETNP